jgi:hypothetical protein
MKPWLSPRYEMIEMMKNGKAQEKNENMKKKV